MSEIIDRPVRAGDLPAELRAGLDADETVLVSIRRVTANGFTDAFEAGVLAAEAEVGDAPFRPAAQVIRELRQLADEP